MEQDRDETLQQIAENSKETIVLVKRKNNWIDNSSRERLLCRTR